jgi:sulfur-carrier protein
VSAVTIRLAALLHSYTGGETTIPVTGATVNDALNDLDRRFPGLRFRVVDEQDRVRRHMRCFVNDSDIRDLATKLRDGDEIFIVGALSGG